MTRPRGYPGRPEFGDDPYDRHGEPSYGQQPPGHGDPPPRHGHGEASGYGHSHADPPTRYDDYGQPPPRYDYREAPRHGYGEPAPDHREPPPRPRYRDPRGNEPGGPAGGRPYDPDSTAQIPMHVPDEPTRSYGGPPFEPPPRYGDPRTAPPYAPQSRPPGRSKVGLLLGIVGGVLALVLIGGAAVFLLGDASDSKGGNGSGSPSVHPDFANPEKVVDSWLDAMFIRKDADKMIRYTCKREADRDEVNEAIKTVEAAEQDAKDAKLSMKVSWTKPKAISTDGAKAKVTSTLKVVVGDKTEKKPASFALVNEAGWKVCDTEMP